VTHRARLVLACAAAAAWLTASQAAGAALAPAGPLTHARQAAANVIPAPAQVVPGHGTFTVRERTRVLIPLDPAAAASAQYFVDLVRSRHAGWLEVIAGSVARVPQRAIAFRLERSLAAAGPESYQIEVSAQRIVVSAGERRGLLYGAVTLWQLCTASAPVQGSIRLPAVRIVDAPRFRWRGLMLDSARHVQSPAFIMRYIDWMALHKLNVLGWHLTDDQGWRLEIRKYPRLTSVGAWRVPAGRAAARDIDPATGRARLYGGFYTQEDVRRIVAHAAARNVTIVPEIDMPGHATAAIVAYPQLGVTSHAPQAVPADWGIYPNLFNVEDSTFDFLEDVLAEVMELFPGEYVHVGGDEAVKNQWQASERVQERMRELGVANEQALQGYFTRRLGEYLRSHGRRLVGWDEILAGGVPADATVMSWRGVQGALAAAAAGHDAVLSPDPTLYLDHRQGTSPSEPPGRAAVVALGVVYRFDPLPGPLPGEREHVLGLQASLWTEHVRTEERVAYMTWPRAAAVAEVAWSPAERLDWADFVHRLPAEFDRYRALGIHYSDDVFASARSVGPYERHLSQDLKTCTDRLVLSLEDDAPIEGERAVFLIDIMNPCWILPAADLSRVSRLTAAVGQVPFNFQLGKDADSIKLNPPHTAAGELEVRLDACEGEPIAVLPLAPAADNDAVTVLPAVPLPRASGPHELCFRFTQRTLDPLWAIDWVQLAP
jgi:hexosaminidase